LERQSNRWAGRLDLLFIQKDERGREYNPASDALELQLLQPNYERVSRDGLTYHKVVVLSPQAKTLRVVVRDAASGSIGSVTIPMNQISGTIL
jgi:hypothetical protein